MHVPGLAPLGSKPRRELKGDEDLASFRSSLRTFEEAVAYAPHQAFIGNLHPRSLPPRPWVGAAVEGQRFGPYGEVMPEHEALGLIAAADPGGLVTITPGSSATALDALSHHPCAKLFDLDALGGHAGDAEAAAAAPGALALRDARGALCGAIHPAHPQDEALSAHVLLENLAAKASGALALAHLIVANDLDPASIDYVISYGEEAVGDRYQRGGGNLAKAIAESCGLTEASGCDVKNFCAAGIPALVVAGALVSTGIARRVAVVAGGSFAKLGMKFQGHLKEGLPVLEDVVAGAAALVTAETGAVELDLASIGKHAVGAGGSNPQIIEALVFEPLARLSLRATDIDDYATELHNPEITEPQGSGDVPARNYRTIAALAAQRGDIERDLIDDFVAVRGMPGYAPTQGHIASAVCYLPHALKRLTSGEAQRVMLLAKGSLFLGRMCQLSDGMSVLLRARGGG
jgi:betaine reductase